MGDEVVKGAFLLFLREFRKVTPRTAETEAMHALIDEFLAQLVYCSAYYDERWGMHLTCDDERTWRSPRTNEIKPCPQCNGVGTHSGALNIQRICKVCEGRGYVVNENVVTEER
jgi:hypothetical protein